MSLFNTYVSCILSYGLKTIFSSGFTLPLLLKTTIFVLFRFTYKSWSLAMTFTEFIRFCKFSTFSLNNVGLMQWESLSPPSHLCSLYVNDIEVELINQGCQFYELKKMELIFIIKSPKLWETYCFCSVSYYY
jgi:hypothetical protein